MFLGKKTFSVSIGVVAIGVVVSIGVVAIGVVVSIGVVAILYWLLSLSMSHFCCLQLLLLYITKYVHQYYLLHYSTYVLYVTAALSLVLL